MNTLPYLRRLLEDHLQIGAPNWQRTRRNQAIRAALQCGQVQVQQIGQRILGVDDRRIGHRLVDVLQRFLEVARRLDHRQDGGHDCGQIDRWVGVEEQRRNDFGHVLLLGLPDFERGRGFVRVVRVVVRVVRVDVGVQATFSLFLQAFLEFVFTVKGILRPSTCDTHSL